MLHTRAVEILADGEPSALDGFSVSLSDLLTGVEILADGEPWALARRPQPHAVVWIRR